MAKRPVSERRGGEDCPHPRPWQHETQSVDGKVRYGMCRRCGKLVKACTQASEPGTSET